MGGDADRQARAYRSGQNEIRGRLDIVNDRCLYQINDNLWEGSFFPRLPNGKRKKFNVYAETKEQCEIKLAEMIERVKAEIVEEKAKLKEGAN